MVTMQLVTATDDPVHLNVGKTPFGSRDGRKLRIGEVSQRGTWFAGCQAMLPGLSGEHHTAREMDSNAIKLEEHRGVYWLPGTVTEPLNGVPVCPNPETASTAVGETGISATDSDTTTMQLKESEETCRHKHKTLARNMNRDEHGARRIAHLQFRITEWEGSGTCAQASGRHARRWSRDGKGPFLLGKSGSSTTCESSLDTFAVGCTLAAIKPTDKSLPIKRGAVKNQVGNTPKTPSVYAGGVEEKRIRTLRSWFEGGICGSGLQSVASRGAALYVADNTPSYEIRRMETD